MYKDKSILLTWTSESGDPAQSSIVISEQPADTAVIAGETVVFNVSAEGIDLAYQWQWSTDGIIWTNCKSGTYNTDTFSFTMKDSYDGRQYRCKITSGDKWAFTRAATVELATAAIISQPSDVEAAVGETVTTISRSSKANPLSNTQLSM